MSTIANNITAIFKVAEICVFVLEQMSCGNIDTTYGYVVCVTSDVSW